MITLHNLADIRAIDQLVGECPDKRWGRGSVTMKRSDGRSVIEWFERYSPKERVQQVQESILDLDPWMPLVRIEIPKANGTKRPIDAPTAIDQAKSYRLYDLLLPEVESRLGKACIGYRFRRSLVNSVREIQQAMSKLPFAFAVDVEKFFEAISWKRLGRIIQSPPCDSGATRMLQELVRVRVVRRDGSLVQRSSGLAQGLSTSPLLANLYLAEFDRLVAHALSKLPGRMFRYSDNILVLLGQSHHGKHSFQIVRDRVQREGLRLKESEPLVIDVREQGLDWLGLRIWPDRIEVTQETVAGKVEQYKADLLAGLRTVESTERRIDGLVAYYKTLTSPERGEEIRLRLREELCDQLTPTPGKENQEREQENTNKKTKIMIPIGLDSREDHHIPPTLLEQDQETGQEEHRHTEWNSLRTPGSPPSPSSFAAIRPVVSKSVGLLPGAPASPAPGEQKEAVVSVRIVSVRFAWITVQRGEDYQHWPFRVTATSHPELELRALAAGVRSIDKAERGAAQLAPGRHARPYLLGHVRPRGVRLAMAYRDLLEARRFIRER